MIEEKQSVGKEYMEHAKNADKKQLDHLLIYCRADLRKKSGRCRSYEKKNYRIPDVRG